VKPAGWEPSVNINIIRKEGKLMKRVNKIFSCMLSVLLIVSIFTTRVIAQGDNDSVTNESEVEFTVVKTWKNDTEGSRPDSITIRLMNGEKGIEILTLDKESSWQKVFSRSRYDEEGNKITYEITEDTIEGYETNISSNTTDINFKLLDTFEKITPARNSKYSIENSNIVVVNKGNNYYIWTLIKDLNEAQETQLIHEINNKVRNSDTIKLNKELEFKSGLPTQFTAIQGNDINTIDILTNTETGKNEIHFSDPSAWSWFYHGTLVVVENIRVDITNEYVGEDEEPGDEEPGDEEPGDEEPGDEEPGDEEPGDEEPGDEEPGDEEPGDEEPGDEEPGDEEPGDEEPGDEEPGDEEPGDEEPGDEEPGDEEPGDEEPGDEEPGDEEPGDEEPDDEEPGDEEPGDEEPGDEERRTR
jgi:hypothetical protein